MLGGLLWVIQTQRTFQWPVCFSFVNFLKWFVRILTLLNPNGCVRIFFNSVSFQPRNLMWTKRGRVCLIIISGTNKNCESMAYRSFRSEEQLEVSEKFAIGITGMWQPSVHSDVALRSIDGGSSYH